MKSFLGQALEAHHDATTVEKEIEYSYFLLLSKDQLQEIATMPGFALDKTFSETKLEFSVEKVGELEWRLASRVRHYLKDGESTYELTTKRWGGNSKTKDEENSAIGELNYRAMMLMGKSTLVRSRYTIPFHRDGQAVLNKKGNPLQWELDLYHIGDGSELHPWVKLELEVDRLWDDEIAGLIPFTYSEIIPSDTKDEYQRLFLDRLHEVDYNVRNPRTLKDLPSIIDFS